MTLSAGEYDRARGRSLDLLLPGAGKINAMVKRFVFRTGCVRIP